MPRFTLHVPKRNEEDLGNVLDTRYVNVAGDTDITGSLIPNADSAIDLGSSTKLWANIYTDNLYVHSGVYLTETAGAVTGVTVQHASSANYIAFVVSTDPVRIIPWGESSGNTLDISGHLTPVSDSSKTLGNTARYWLSTYTDKLYLNSTAILDGATAGVAKLNGGLLVEPDIDTLTALVVNDTDSNNVLTVDTINNRVGVDELRALSASGLKLYEDGGKGIFVQNSTGNVGIGTTAPGSILHVWRNANSLNKAITVTNENAYWGTNRGSYIDFNMGQYNRNVYVGALTESGAGGAFFVSTAPGAAYNSPVERLRITSAGNVGIGVTDPDTKLEIFKAGNQLKLSFDATDNAIFAVDINGDLTIIPSGSNFIIPDAKNIALNTTTGSKLGTATGQKLGFWGITPVVQQVLATGGGATVDNVISLLQTLGLCKQA